MPNILQLVKSITDSLQGVYCDLVSANKHIHELINYISNDRANNEEVFASIMNDVNIYLNKLCIDLVVPRVTSKQTLRNSLPPSDPVDYCRKSVYIPYLDSLITSLYGRLEDIWYKIIESLK